VCTGSRNVLVLCTESMTGMVSVLFLGLACFMYIINEWLGWGNVRKTGLVCVMYLSLAWSVYCI
jgi:hypothetical protein